jgi:hypothetical protein
VVLTVLAIAAFVPIGVVLLYCVGGDLLNLVDLDKVFPTRLSLLLTLGTLGIIELILWDYLFP